MRILHVIPGLGTPGGGPSIVCQSLARSQKSLGHDVSILSTLLQLTEEEREKIVEEWGSDVRLLSFRYVKGFLWAPKAAETLRQGPRPDVVHIHGLWSGLNTTVARYCRQRSIPYVIRTLGTLGKWALYHSRWKKQIYSALWERSNLNGAAAVHVLNEAERQAAEDFGVKRPLVVIPNGVDASLFDNLPRSGLFRERTQGLSERFLILFLSRIHKKKGLEFLAEAFCILRKKHPSAFLLIAGPEEDDSGRRAAAVIEAENAQKDVVFTDVVRGEEKQSILVDSDIFVLPTFEEGHSMAVTEALAFGLPVIITPGCHFPEVERHGAGFIVSQAPEELADAMEKLMMDAELRARMGEAGRKLVRENYTWDRIAERTLDLYTNILDGKALQ